MPYAKSQARRTAERKAAEFVKSVKADVNARKLAQLAELRSGRAEEGAGIAARSLVASKAQKVLNRVALALRNGQLDANELDRQRLREIVGGALNDQRANLLMRNMLSTAYNAGLKQQGERDNTKQFWLYETMRDQAVRPEHRRWDGLLLAKDDELAAKIFPPNGHNCRCRMTAVSRASAMDAVSAGNATFDKPELETVEYVDQATGETKSTLRGVDPGWMGAPDDSPDAIGAMLERQIKLLQAWQP